MGIYFAKSGSTATWVDRDDRFDVDIPAAEAPHQSAQLHHAGRFEVINVTPHMHMIGKEMKVAPRSPIAAAAIGMERLELQLAGPVRYPREPIKLPAGTRLDLEAWYDNSAAIP